MTRWLRIALFAFFIAQTAQSSLAAAPTTALDTLNVGREQEAKGNLDGAITSYTKAIELDPKFALAHSLRGDAYEKKWMYVQAFKDYSEAIRVDPKCIPAYLSRSHLHELRGDLKSAIADLSETIRVDPNGASLHAIRGTYYQKKGDLDLAETDFTRAIELEPKNSLAFFHRGLIYRRKGEYDKAIANYDRWIEVEPGNPDAYNGRSSAYFKKGDKARADADFKRVMELMRKGGRESSPVKAAGSLPTRSSPATAGAASKQDEAGRPDATHTEQQPAAPIKTISIPGLFTVGLPDTGYTWRKAKDEPTAASGRGVTYSCSNPAGEDRVVLSIVLQPMDTADARQKMIRSHYRMTFNRFNAGGFRVTAANEPSLQSPIPSRVLFSLKAEGPNGATLFVHSFTVFGKNTFALDICSPDETEARKHLETIWKSFREPEAGEENKGANEVPSPPSKGAAIPLDVGIAQYRSLYDAIAAPSQAG